MTRQCRPQRSGRRHRGGPSDPALPDISARRPGSSANGQRPPPPPWAVARPHSCSQGHAGLHRPARKSAPDPSGKHAAGQSKPVHPGCVRPGIPARGATVRFAAQSRNGAPPTRWPAAATGSGPVPETTVPSWPAYEFGELGVVSVRSSVA
ncbi:hypothetical protein SDC9_159988 [bioreactor metagenome]|uniref:Uncharacterized protein n=1 Tax=bioreactor metagenome TaxID=1076179 RepID=A0A645FH46_9ZZZZ